MPRPRPTPPSVPAARRRPPAVSRRPHRASSTRSALTRRSRRPGPAPALEREGELGPTRNLLFAAAAEEFAAKGFDGASVDAIADAARVNKAMIYYHFDGKLGLYRDVVRDMLRMLGARVEVIAASADDPATKIARFVDDVARTRDERPWFPPLMLREMSAGAPHLDPTTLGMMRTVFAAFASMVSAGVKARVFRPVHPVLAYMSILGPLLMNAARERAAAGHGKHTHPLFVSLDRDELVAHMRHTALRMLAR